MKKPLALLLSLIFALPAYAGTIPFEGYNSYEDSLSSYLDYGDVFDAVHYAKEEGYFTGYDDGSFRSDTEVNRAELAKVLILASGVTELQIEERVDEFIATGEAGFTDVDPADRESIWYVDYVLYAQAEGIVSGYPDGSYVPSDPVLNVELMKMLVESQYGSPSEDYAGGQWYEIYSNFLIDMNILRTGEYYPGEYFYFTYNIEADLGYTSDVDAKSLRGGVAELIYRLQQVWDGETLSPYVGRLSFEDYAETYDVDYIWQDGFLSLSDPNFGYAFDGLPVGEMEIDDLWLEIAQVYGHENAYYTRLDFVVISEYYQSTYKHDDNHDLRLFAIYVYDPDSYEAQAYGRDAYFICNSLSWGTSDSFTFEYAVASELCYDSQSIVEEDINLRLL